MDNLFLHSFFFPNFKHKVNPLLISKQSKNYRNKRYDK
uniref:Uncharacterized protein n=1 Tax=Faecalibaculum rodentium TaxID=1702221 RepID=A0A140DRY0_9FIRM|nr:hypothetical protein AALO17_02730 [Faecalibaculum rodentium]